MIKRFQKPKIINNEESIGKFEVRKESEIEILNDDCLNYIFGFLQIEDKVKIERVCKRWQEVSKNSWKNIKTLNENVNVWGFNPCIRSPEELTLIFEKVLQRCGHTLTHVDFSFLSVQNNALHHVAIMCPNLQSLNVGKLNLTIPLVEIMTANCQNIKEITFTTCSEECNDYQLSKFFSVNKKLRYLKITNNENLTGKFLESLPRDSMQTIIMNDCTKVTSHNIAQFIANFENLRTLSFTENQYLTFDDSTAIIVSLSKNIVELRLGALLKLNTNATSSLTNLQILDVTNSEDISNTFLTVLAKNWCTQITDAGINEISRLPKLEELYIKNLNNVTDQSLKYLPKLKRLSCASSGKIRDDGLCTLISSCDSIELLDCKHLDSESVNDKSPLLDLLLPSTNSSGSNWYFHDYGFHTYNDDDD
ncbi:F-box/LRR-repeat protein 14 [Nasonia vitripennis]|uniref:F-box domain-containing protein n=1 Tax=Nasonia vitripennis TaxID=7425 RepID=A0A7M7QWU2_NASVI|nr:F-box/LRR-repeat protein 14 [Nasonia vitripennis]